MDGDVAEYAAWSVELTAGEHSSLGAGVPPLLIRPASLVFYARLVSSEDIDIVGGLALAPSGSPTVSAHPRVFMAAPPMSIAPAAAVTTGGFFSNLPGPLGMIGGLAAVAGSIFRNSFGTRRGTRIVRN